MLCSVEFVIPFLTSFVDCEIWQSHHIDYKWIEIADDYVPIVFSL